MSGTATCSRCNEGSGDHYVRVLDDWLCKECYKEAVQLMVIELAERGWSLKPPIIFQ